METRSASPSLVQRSRRRSRLHMGVFMLVACSYLDTTTVTATVSTALTEVSDNRRTDSSDSLLDLVQEALMDASRPLQPVRRERNTQSRWGPRFRKLKKSLSKMLSSSSAVSTLSVPDEVVPDVSIPQPRQRQRKRPQRISDTGDMFDIEMVEGARLISATFGLIANTFGLIADGVRISGDTAAGVMGSSVKMMGSAVVSMSSNFDNAGRILEPKEDTSERRKGLTSERLRVRKQGKGGDQDEFGAQHGPLLQNTRNVAAKSVKLIGSVFRGLGDSLLLVGAATETIASSTTGVAEDAVRIVEDLAGSVSFALSPNGGARQRIKTNIKFDPHRFEEPDDEEGAEPPLFVTFGSYADPDSFHDSGSPESSDNERRVHGTDGFTIPMLELGLQTLWKFVKFLAAETQSVPSFAGELLGVIILCYFAALWQISAAAGRQQCIQRNGHDQTINVPMLTNDDEASISSHEYSEDHGTSPVAALIEKSGSAEKSASIGFVRFIVGTLLLPFRILRCLISTCLRVLFSRQTALFFVYCCAWIYLSRASQLRSSAIQRNAEASGYRNAIESVGRTSLSISESAVWLNALLSQIWRVRYDPASKEGAQWETLSREYPKFVRRSIRSNTYGRFECRSCEWEGNEDNRDLSTCLPYGGLEPYISGNIGALILGALEDSKASRQNDVAYTSLYSFTLGHKPPLIRNIELLGASQDASKLHFNVEVDAILEDLSLVLEVKLSSLDYAILPSTKVSIHAIDVTLPIKASISARPDYPYVDILELSLSEAPSCNVRITPLSGQSGLRGVDVGSLPVIREWIQDVIRETLSEYVTPNFIAIDLAAWLTAVPVSTGMGIPPHSIPDIAQLRQKTRVLVNPNPRTSSSEGVKISSVAETLPSHRSVSSTAFVQDDRRAATKREISTGALSLVKPTTKLSRLGMDRWIEKSEEDPSSVRAGSKQDGIVDLLAKPLALVSPFLIAVAAGVFRDRVVREEE